MADLNQNRTEDEIERLHKELERARAEFEDFVSMTAHNLRDSLRDVAANSQLVAETYAGRLDPDGRILLRRIEEGAARMQSLLADVVDYSITGTGESSARIDMEAALTHVLLCADKPVQDRGAIVTHDPLPQVRGDFEILTRVLHHLIRNAIEFSDTPAPRVHIAARRHGAEWIFSVQDNGPGIESEFQGRLFGPFQRLHGKDHPGNGLGLAFCKKAIERLGGRIWLESTPGAGSIFYFTVTPVD